jgi:hypothetical protein
VQRAERERTARVNAERREFLHSRLFQNATLSGDVARLRAEDGAREMLRRAFESADNHRQIEILRVAVDNRWASVLNAFIKAWDGEHPISDTVRELWTLTTTGRDSA